MKTYGPLRNYWEGGFRGEGVLRIVKPEHKTLGLKKGFAKNVLEHVSQKKTLANISGGQDWEEEGEKDEEGGTNDDTVLELQKTGEREYFLYPNESFLYAEIRNDRPLSVVQTVCGKVGCVLSTNTIILLVRPNKNNDEVVHGVPFRTWKISDQTGKILRIGLSTVSIAFAFLLLPHHFVKYNYYGVRSDWKEMDLSGNFVDAK